MKQLITDLAILETPAEPLTFITETGTDTTECEEIISELQEVFKSNADVVSLSAPQIGINKRIFGIKFNDDIKFFINPIITKKSGSVIAPETFNNLPGKEILISRPSEITAVYYNAQFMYEDNKFLDAAARLFDQQCQLLDGVLPTELGLVSDIKEDGPLSDLSEDEIAEVTEFYKKFIANKAAVLEKEIKANDNLAKKYNNLKFTESVINGRSQVIVDNKKSINTVLMEDKNKAIEKKAKLEKFLRNKK